MNMQWRSWVRHQPVSHTLATCSSRDNKASFSLQEAHLPCLLWTVFPSLGEKRFLEIFSQGLFPRSWGGPWGPNSQGKAKPHGQVYALWESSSEPHLSGTFLAPIKTPLCVKLHSLSGGLKCAAMHLLENPSTYSSLALTDVLFL